MGKPVNATGGIDRTGDKRIDGKKTKDAIEFVQTLANSERVEQVFVRHVFRFFAGRNENLGDGPSLRAAHKAYRESGGRFQELRRPLYTTDAAAQGFGRDPGSATRTSKQT